MKEFIKKVIIFGVVISGFMYICVIIQRDAIWNITNSISMDAKLSYIYEKEAWDVDIVGIGSSMTLNNLNTAAVLEAISFEKKYFNYGAWGMQISDTKIILENLLQTLKPESVIVFSNIVDFYSDSESRYKTKDLKNYMDGFNFNDISIVSKYAFPNNIENGKLYNTYANNNQKYTSLKFDSNGGVPLEVYGENIEDARWNLVLEKGCVNEVQYVALEELCQLANDKEMRLFFVQTPTRAHYLSGAGADEMKRHQERCKDILEQYGQHYYCSEDLEKYDDTLFADYIHLNKEGSYLFTTEFMKYYNECDYNRGL